MFLIIQYLEFTSYRRSFSFVQSGINKILDAGISSLRNNKVKLQDEILIDAGGYNITSMDRFPATAFNAGLSLQT